MKLILNNISKSYGSTLALNGFSAVLEPGIYALLGPNGSGKSTLMNIITDNLKADNGEMLYSDNGEEPISVRDKKLCFRSHIGFMPQYPGLYPSFTAKQFLEYVAVLKDIGSGLSKKERNALIDEQVTEVLEAVELSDVSNRKIKTFSGGMKQRLALAQAVLGDPKILILDEPTAGLDPKQRISVRNYISRMALNKIVIIATHVVPDVEFIAKDYIFLKKGTVIKHNSLHNLLSEIEGKVWEVCVPEEEITALQEKFSVTSITKSESEPGKVILRVISDTAPHPSAKTLSPVLEDYYLMLFGDNILTSDQT